MELKDGGKAATGVFDMSLSHKRQMISPLNLQLSIHNISDFFFCSSSTNGSYASGLRE